jgi:ferredoxin
MKYTKINQIAKGWSSYIWIVKDSKGKEFVLKEVREKSNRKNLAEREGKMLLLANSVGVGPKIKEINYKENFVKLLEKKGALDRNKSVAGINNNIVTIGLNLYASHVRLVLDKEKCILCDVSHTICPKEAITVKEDITINNKWSIWYFRLNYSKW